MAKWVINFNNEPIFLLFAQVCEKLQNGTTHSWLRNCIVFFVGTFSTADRQKRVQPCCICTRLLQKWTIKLNCFVHCGFTFIFDGASPHLNQCAVWYELVYLVYLVWILGAVQPLHIVVYWFRSVQCFHILCSSPFYIGKRCPNSAVYRRGNCSLIPDIGCLQPKSKIRYIQEFYLPHQAKMEFFLEFCFLYQTLCSQKVKYFIQTKLFFQRHFF